MRLSTRTMRAVMIHKGHGAFTMSTRSSWCVLSTRKTCAVTVQKSCDKVTIFTRSSWCALSTRAIRAVTIHKDIVSFTPGSSHACLCESLSTAVFVHQGFHDVLAVHKVQGTGIAVNKGLGRGPQGCPQGHDYRVWLSLFYWLHIWAVLRAGAAVYNVCLFVCLHKHFCN